MNKPLSCHLGMHFFKQVGKAQECMYCDYAFITRKYKDASITLVRNPLFDEPKAKDVLLRNVEKE